MELHIRILGLDLLALSLTTEQTVFEAASEDESPGDCTTYPIGFTGTSDVPDMAGPYREGWE